MAQLLGDVAVGTTVYLNENGSPQPYLVVNQGLPSAMYDESCNGTWLLRTNIYANTQWDNNNTNNYASSTINTTYLPNTILPLYDVDIQNAIQQVKIPYVNGTGGSPVASGSNGLSCKIFLLSCYEVGFSQSINQYFPIDGAKLSYFELGTNSDADNKRIANLDGLASNWWLRSPYTSNTYYPWFVSTNGKGNSAYSGFNSYGVRPALVLSSNSLYVWDDGTVSTFAGPSTTFAQLPSQAMTGQQIPISWNAIDSADSYILQRNADNGVWTQVYSGTATSFADTAGSWTTVQYQVQGVFSGTGGPWTPSASIPVISASALVISGTDSDLGTITSDIPYTVSSDTGNDITLTRTVNGVQVASLTVQSGFAYNIPVVDLPTGTGTIVISASVTASSGTVTATRTWTYTKTAMTFPNSAGIGQLTQNGQNIWPLTVLDAIKTPAYMGGNLGTALNQLSRAVLYNQNQIAKYSEVNINLSNVFVGDEVNLPYNGVMVPHIVVQIGNPDAEMYDSSCDGVWLLRKDIYANAQWNSSNVNNYATSTVNTTYLSNTILPLYDITIQNAIQQIKIPYVNGPGGSPVASGSNGLSCKLFLLSGYEVGWTTSTNPYLPVDGAKLSYFESGTGSLANNKRIGYYNSSATYWWLRSPLTHVTSSAWFVNSSGDYNNNSCSNSYGIRPCFIMPTTFTATYYVDSLGNVQPNQEYISAGSYEDILGNTIPVPKIETGSYVGTGTYGVDNPNTLTFGFAPKFVIVYTNGVSTGNQVILFNPAITAIGFSQNSGWGLSLSWNENSVSWYHEEYASQQFNASETTYYYYAIG